MKLESMNIDKISLCFFFSIYPVFFVLTALVYLKMTRPINPSIVIILGAVISSVINLTMGLYQSGFIKKLDATAYVVHAKEKSFIIWAAIKGIADCLMFIPVMHEMNKQI